MNPAIAVRMVGDVAVVDMTGRFTIGEGADSMRGTVKERFDSGRKNILLSLKGVTYIDSSGLGQLAGCYATASRMGAEFKILNSPGKVHDMLQITRLFTVFVSFSDEGEAIRSFLRP